MCLFVLPHRRIFVPDSLDDILSGRFIERGPDRTRKFAKLGIYIRHDWLGFDSCILHNQTSKNKGCELVLDGSATV
jgi:hypothetical protein